MGRVAWARAGRGRTVLWTLKSSRRTANAGGFSGVTFTLRAILAGSAASMATRTVRRRQPSDDAGLGSNRDHHAAAQADRVVGLTSPWKLNHDSRSSSRIWLTRAALTPNRLATSPVRSPVARTLAIRRWRLGNRRSQAAKSILLAASSAGVQR